MLSMGWLFSHAQPYASRLGGFQVNQIRGCAPLTITVTELLASGFCTCNYNYEGTQTTTSKTHTFNNPGSYKVNGTFQAGVPLPGGGSTDDITITVTANVQPAFEISSCTGGQVSIKVTDTQYNQYLVDFNNDLIDDRTITAGGNQSATFSYGSIGLKTISIRGKDFNSADNCAKKIQSFTALAALPAATINTLTVVDASSIKLDYTPNVNIQYRAQVATNSATAFQQFQTFNSASGAQQSATLIGLTTDAQYYCFRINAYDPCNNSIVPSNTICSADFDLNLVSDNNQLDWTTSVAGVTDFAIRRDQVNYQNVAVTNYDDTNIICNTDYCYSIVTNYPNGSTSISLEKCGKSFTSTVPTAIENASAVVNASALDLSWVQDPAFTAQSYNIKRSEGSSLFVGIGSATAANYTDNSYATSGNYCYMIDYTDVCANSSPAGATICPIQLSGSIGSSNEIQLNWSAYLGWKIGVKRYHIDKYDQQGVFVKTFTTTNLTLSDNASDPDNQVVEYIVRAEPKDATQPESVSNRLKVTRQARLIFPTAFTPNKDNLNENFSVVGQYVENMTLKIFDRWGTLLFSTDTNEAWDGTHDGRQLSESTYIWKAFITDKTGKTFTKIGSVALLRKDK